MSRSRYYLFDDKQQERNFIGVSLVEDSERCEMRYDLSWVLHELGLGHLRESPRNEYLEAGEQPTTYVSRYAKIGQTGAEHFNTAWELKGRLPIYVYLSQNGATKGAVMQRALGMIRSSFYQRLGWLQEEGIVERVDGKYRLIGVNIVKVLRIKERIEEIKRSYQRRWEKYCAWMEEKIDDLDRYKAVRTLRSFINARKTTAFA